MTPKRWAQIEEIFQAALDCAPAARASFIKKQCGDDDDLCAAVENLINRHDTGNPFLESPVWTDSLFFQTTLKNEIASSLNEEVETMEKRESLAGEIVGAYRLTEEIGRGGMGVVYAARRVDDFRQTVAVKIVKRGMDTDFILRRFRRERQVLAQLDHPNIARLFDGGATTDGRPFLVMELVEGSPIDKFCDANKLTVEARLKLFRAVCAAVGYSHQRLIVHRDIKPSNILVTNDGAPKLLDFGIAKLLDANLDSSAFQPTATEARMMTPDYASPEQLRGESVTTVSDVYSLGVLLYFLLTGHLPFNYADQPGAFARLVSEQNPERPSAIITGGGEATRRNHGKQTNRQSLITVAENRRTEPERLRRRLADDLDNIVLRALHKDARRRYSSVEQFSEDIGRHLAGLPVAARGDDFAYKTRKFVRRNRKSVLTAGLLSATLLGGSAATAWQANIADRERIRAEAGENRAENRFNESRRLTESLLFELHDAIRDLQGATKARELLAKRTLEHLDGLALEAADDAVLQGELTIAYINLGNIQGNPYYPNLGDTGGALESYRKAEKLAESLATANPDQPPLARRFWLTQIRIADVLAARGDLEAARQIYGRAASIIENLASNHPADESLRGDLATSYDRQGNVLMKTKNYRAALEFFRKTLEIFERTAQNQPDNDAPRRAVGAAHGKIGTAHLRLNEPEKALGSKEKLVRINEARLARDPANAVTLDDVGGSWRELGDAQAALGNYREAFESYRKQSETFQKLAAADSANVRSAVEAAISHQRVGVLQTKIGDFKSALENHDKTLRILRELESKNPQNTFVLNQMPAAFYYSGAANFAHASAVSSARRKKAHLETARSFFQQSLDAFAKLPAISIVLPPEIESTSDIESRIAECSKLLDR